MSDQAPDRCHEVTGADADLLAGFKAHLVALHRSPATVDNYVKNVRRYLSHLAKQGIAAVDADANDIEAYQGSLVARPLPLPTVDTYMRSVLVFCKFLLGERLVLQSPADLVELPRVLKRLPRNVMTEKEVLKLLSMPNTQTNRGILQRAIMETLYSSGIRVGELCALTLDDVDTAKGEIRIRHGKGDKFRIAVIGNEACLWIRAYRELVRPTFATPNENALFFGVHYGHPINRQVVRIFIRRFGKKEGLRVTPHSFRHAAATHMFRHGASLMQVREFLGHSLVTTTERYVEVTVTDLRREIRRHHPRR